MPRGREDDRARTARATPASISPAPIGEWLGDGLAIRQDRPRPAGMSGKAAEVSVQGSIDRGQEAGRPERTVT